MHRAIYSLFQQQVTINISELSPSSNFFKLELVIKKKITVVVRKMRGGRKSEFKRKTTVSQEDKWPF